MKMMSWSRYHCLPKRPPHARIRCRAAKSFTPPLRIRGRQTDGVAPIGFFQIVIRLFRT